MTKSDTVRFRGTRNGVHVVIDPEGDLKDVLVELDHRLRGSDQFFRSANVMLNLDDRGLDAAEFAALQDVLARYGLSVISVYASHTDTRNVCRGLGLQVESPEPMSPLRASSGGDVETATARLAETSETAGARRLIAGEALVVHKTLRSGQSLNHSGDVCLIGDVNPGAEILAGENVIVWGSLRGVVQAGMRGNDEAVVCALELTPTQLRIGGLVTRQPESDNPVVVPELARITDGQIMVEQWIPRARRLGRKF